MSIYNDILCGNEESLLQVFYKYRTPPAAAPRPLSDVAAGLKLRPEQLLCAIGFNPDARYLVEILPLLGFATFKELDQERNACFTTDIYKRLSLDNVLKIYERIRDRPQMLDVMQHQLRTRLEKIESEIESTVNSMIIDKYKSEMRAIYNYGIADVDFTEERLDRRDSGFRALLNEVSMIVESRIIPVGEIFFRDSVLPQEKRKLLNKGLIPRELIQSRINEEGISQDEKKVLSEYLRQNT